MIFDILKSRGIPFAVMTSTSYFEELIDNFKGVQAKEWFMVVPSEVKYLDFGFSKSHYSRSILERSLSNTEVDHFMNNFADYGMKKVHHNKDGRVYEMEGCPIKFFYGKRGKFAK